MKRGFSSYSLAANRDSRNFRYPLRRLPKGEKKTPFNRPRTRNGLRIAAYHTGQTNWAGVRRVIERSKKYTERRKPIWFGLQNGEWVRSDGRR